MKYSILATIIAISIIVFNNGCKKNGSENETNISSTGSNKSHNMGQNCMTCHKSGGQGEGWFNAAGTVYDITGNATSANGFVDLYTMAGGQGTLVATVKVDGKGNFYTTESIAFGSGLYPVVTSAAGNKAYMSSPTTSGACNSCHGVSQGKIQIN